MLCYPLSFCCSFQECPSHPLSFSPTLLGNEEAQNIFPALANPKPPFSLHVMDSTQRLGEKRVRKVFHSPLETSTKKEEKASCSINLGGFVSSSSFIAESGKQALSSFSHASPSLIPLLILSFLCCRKEEEEEDASPTPSTIPIPLPLLLPLSGGGGGGGLRGGWRRRRRRTHVGNQEKKKKTVRGGVDAVWEKGCWLVSSPPPQAKRGPSGKRSLNSKYFSCPYPPSALLPRAERKQGVMKKQKKQPSCYTTVRGGCNTRPVYFKNIFFIYLIFVGGTYT